MARVTVFEGGNIQRQGTTSARVRPADFSASPMAEGLKAAGSALAGIAEKQDEIEDVRARVEANRLAVEHSEHTRQIGQRVKQTLGEDADGAATLGMQDLEKATKDIIARASPRARMLLQDELRQRSGIASDSWLDHGYRQKADALETTSVARINRITEDAADLEDEDAALQMLSGVREINERRARFFGKGEDWRFEEDQKVVSTFYKSRALKLATGAAGSASAAIGYAEKNRELMTDDDYLSIVNAYNDAAQDEAATAIVYGGANPIGAAVEPGPEEDGGPPARLDPMSFFKAFTVPHEGTTYVTDSNGAGVKYGINEQYNPGVDVKNLTEAKAAKIFTDKYFKRSGADKLPPALAAAHVDTFFLNERQAGKILRESGGDVDRYIELRRAFLNGLARTNPGKYGRYQKGWENRTKALAAYADRLGGDGTPLPIDPETSLEGARQAVMARTDIGLNLKRRIINQMEGRRAEVRQERAIAEEDVDRGLTSAALGLGEGFTDIKQLPQDLWIAANPSTRVQFTNMAKANKEAKENKPLTPELAAQIGFLRTFRPESLADPQVLKQLAGKGVPARVITQLAQEGGQARGAIAGAKADPIPRGTLESIARPAFEAAGHFLWTVESTGKNKAKAIGERQGDAQRQVQLLGFLSEAAQLWAINNPGKRPDEKTIKGWVGTALLRNRQGMALGTMTDDRVVVSMSEPDRKAIIQKLQSAGLPVSVENIATYYRRLRIMRGDQ